MNSYASYQGSTYEHGRRFISVFRGSHGMHVGTGDRSDPYMVGGPNTAGEVASAIRGHLADLRRDRNHTINELVDGNSLAEMVRSGHLSASEAQQYARAAYAQIRRENPDLPEVGTPGTRNGDLAFHLGGLVEFSQGVDAQRQQRLAADQTMGFRGQRGVTSPTLGVG